MTYYVSRGTLNSIHSHSRSITGPVVHISHGVYHCHLKQTLIFIKSSLYSHLLEFDHSVLGGLWRW